MEGRRGRYHRPSREVDRGGLRPGGLGLRPTQPVALSDPRWRGRRRTPGGWHPARDAFSAQVPCRPNRKSLPLPLAWRHRAPGGPPSSPATRQPALTSSRHRVPPASICRLLPPAPSACLFFFQNHRLPPRRSSRGGGVLHTPLCPPQPHQGSRPWRRWCGRLGPWAGRRPGFHRPLPPAAAGGIGKRRERGPFASACPGKGLRVAPRLSWPPPCSVCPPPSPEGVRQGLGQSSIRGRP